MLCKNNCGKNISIITLEDGKKFPAEQLEMYETEWNEAKRQLDVKSIKKTFVKHVCANFVRQPKSNDPF